MERVLCLTRPMTLRTQQGPSHFPSDGLSLAGYRGIEAEAAAVFEAAEPAAIARGGEGIVLTFAEHARAVLYNGLGRYESALVPAQSAAYRDEMLVSVWSLPELVEAATRCGQGDVAAAAIESLSERTRAAGSELALGIEARSKALLSDWRGRRSGATGRRLNVSGALGWRSNWLVRTCSTANG